MPYAPIRLRRPAFFALLFLLATGAMRAQNVDPGATLDQQMAERRRAFLKAREEMRTLPPAATPRPVVRPTPAPPPQTSVAPSTPAPAPAAPAASATLRSAEVRPSPAGTPALRTPPPPVLASSPEPQTPVVVQKSGGQNGDENTDYPAPQRKKRYFFGLFGGGPDYRFLTSSVLDAIDRAHVRSGRWKYIVVHNSETRQGSARAFDYYHRNIRHMPNGLAYHFVIGNGTTTGDGEIEIGPRWTRQINGGHVHSDYLNNIALGICLVGDFNRDVPTRNQYAALDELINYLRKRVGRVERRLSVVVAHKEINPVPTDCPGNRFSYTWLHRKFDQGR